MHTNVSEVSQGYLCDAVLLRDRPRNLLSATESVAPRRSPGKGTVARVPRAAILPESGSGRRSID